jgi:hypothetical protein
MKVRMIAIAVLAGAGAALGQADAQPAATPASSAPPAAPKPGDHVLRLTNAGGGGITAIYVAKTGTHDESDDLLGKQTAGPGKTVVLKVKDPGGDCIFDLQFLMNDGAMVTKKAINLCQTTEMSFTP